MSIRILFLALTALALLSACGGGSDTPPPPSPPVDTDLTWDEDDWDEKDWV